MVEESVQFHKLVSLYVVMYMLCMFF